MSLSLKMNKLTDLTGKVTLVTKGDTEVLQMEVTVKESILSVVDKIKKADGKLDILISSLKACKEDATASVINIASGAGQIRLSFGYFAYASLKVGTSLLTRLLAADFALKNAPIRPSNIRKDCKYTFYTVMNGFKYLDANPEADIT
ncbi:NAD-binding protein [Sanghuangporus baumii]|uniref:NAD-binding protein n=1 Tax=Sanghuangporus baumii TaxID=108892 RepID=A0A9Q5N793_SANBA|nr:NAD-binding protein [Sanghuangporus baumii]